MTVIIFVLGLILAIYVVRTIQHYEKQIKDIMDKEYANKNN